MEYPTETRLKLKSREFSFARIIVLIYQIV